MLNHTSYRKFISLGDDTRLMLRLLSGQDQEGLQHLFQGASDEEVRLMPEDFRDPDRTRHWLERLDYRRELPLVAVDLQHNQLVAHANLHKGKHAARHVGEVRIYVAAAFRSLGLGSLMLGELIQLSLKENLHWLKAEVVAEHRQVISAFRARGFQVKAILEDYFLRQDGGTRDVALMTRPVIKEEEAEF
jgi:L-amino acid N-acyltransferase YncA